MTIRSFFRMMNRGVLLAAALLIGLLGYLAIDVYNFTAEKLLIESIIEDYAVDAAGLMILPEKDYQKDKPAPQSVVDKKMEENQAVLDQYLTDNAFWKRRPSARQSAQWSLEHVFQTNQQNAAHITECRFEILDIYQLKRIGVNAASARIHVRTKFKAIGDPSYFQLFIADDQYVSSEPVEGEPDTGIYSYSEEIIFMEVLLRRVGGDWKIAEANLTAAEDPGRAVGQ